MNNTTTHHMIFPLLFVNGKFMRDGVEVKPIIGNDEQIALLKKAEEHVDGITVASEVWMTETLSWACICGGRVLEDTFEYAEHETPSYRGTIECLFCKSKYEITECEHRVEPVLLLSTEDK